MQDCRARRWHWWRALARIKVYVQQLYVHTPFAARSNAVAAGNPGQEVVRLTSAGVKATITWVPSDRRIVVSHANAAIQSKLTVGFAQWNPGLDMARRY